LQSIYGTYRHRVKLVVSCPVFSDGFRFKYTFIQVYYVRRQNVVEKQLNIIHCLLTNRICNVRLLTPLYYRVGPVLNYSTVSDIVCLIETVKSRVKIRIRFLFPEKRLNRKLRRLYKRPFLATSLLPIPRIIPKPRTYTYNRLLDMPLPQAYPLLNLPPGCRSSILPVPAVYKF